MVFSGTGVARGRGRAIVTATGMDTEMGAVARLLAETRRADTPLQREVARIGRMLGAVVIGIAVVSFGHPLSGTLGWDFETYRDAAARWLAGGGFYDPRQLAGPWTFVTSREVVYPPTSLALFVPFVFLPAVLWWAVPAALTAWSVWQHRPNALAWLLIAVALLNRMSLQQWWVGNPVIWCAAAVALATVRPYLGPLVLVKPTWAPLALVGVRDRRWWLLLAAWGLVVIATLPLWSQYLAVMGNFRGIPVYWLPGNAPVIALPVIAWLGTTRRRAISPQPAPVAAEASGPAAVGPAPAL
jgi:hypothetical protein